jgi:hypothetical protein
MIGDLEKLGKQFVDYIHLLSASYKTPNILFIWGDDFRFSGAEHQFRNMKKLIDYVNNRPFGVKAKFATPSEYFEAVELWMKQNKQQFPTLEHDFVPYVDIYPFDYWSGKDLNKN